MRKRNLRSAFGVTLGVVFTLSSAGAIPAFAQRGATGNPNQFGLQGRANAVSRMIVLGVQQGISSLPPTSGQALSYRFDPEVGTFVDSELMGPTSFRSTQLVGKGNFSFRFATSYFELSDKFGPISYFIEPEDPNNTSLSSGYGRFGVKASAKVALFNFALNYGVTDRLELMFNLPVTRVDAKGSQSFTSRAATFDGIPPGPGCAPAFCTDLPPDEAVVSGAATEDELDALLRLSVEAEDGTRNPSAIRFRTDSFASLGANFEDGINAGVGRISVGARSPLLTTDYIGVAIQSELFFPSPSEDEYAGSESWAILPRLILQVTPLEHFWLHSDVGYDYDFDTSNLRRLVWNAGGSVPFSRFSIDAGVGGSEFDEGVEWTPKTIHGAAVGNFPATVGTRQGSAGVGSSFVDFIGGFKVRILEKTVLGGSVNVPLNHEGFRAEAVGTVAVEQYF